MILGVAKMFHFTATISSPTTAFEGMDVLGHLNLIYVLAMDQLGYHKCLVMGNILLFMMDQLALLH